MTRRAGPSRRSRSSSVGSRSLRIDDGRESPGLPMAVPPELTTARTFLPERITSSETPPSPRWIGSPTRSSDRTFSRSTTIRSAVECWANPSTRSISWPMLSSTGVVPKDPARILGPGMSTMIARSGASLRSLRSRARFEGMSPWAKDRRKTSTPAATRALMTSSPSDAGPMVATIRVRRTSPLQRFVQVYEVVQNRPRGLDALDLVARPGGHDDVGPVDLDHAQSHLVRGTELGAADDVARPTRRGRLAPGRAGRADRRTGRRA